MKLVLSICVIIFYYLEFMRSNEISYIDPATKDTKIIRNRDGKVLNLVMSDEFDVEFRDFSPGKDPFFEAIEKPDDTNDAIEFCNISFL